MPKMKTRKGVRKRFKLTASGKVKRKKAYLRHIMSAKTRSQKRHLRKGEMVSAVDAPAIKRMLPYG